MQSTAGMSAKLTTNVIKQKKNRRVRHFALPGLGRFSHTFDRGEGSLFGSHFLNTNLSIVHRDPEGGLIEEIDAGSGVTTNLFAASLAYDFGVPGVSTTAAACNIFKLLKWHQWGGKETAATSSDWKINEQLNEKTNLLKGKEGVSTVTWGPKFSERKFVQTATMECGAAPLEIKEWGLFAGQEPKGTEETGAAVAPTATTFAVKAASLTASSTTVRGAVNEVIWIKETTEPLGVITSNTTGVVTVGGFIKAGTEETGVPKESSKYNLYPLMADHRAFKVINLSEGNSVQFIWELTFEANK